MRPPRSGELGVPKQASGRGPPQQLDAGAGVHRPPGAGGGVRQRVQRDAAQEAGAARGQPPERMHVHPLHRRQRRRARLVSATLNGGGLLGLWQIWVAKSPNEGMAPPPEPCLAEIKLYKR